MLQTRNVDIAEVLRDARLGDLRMLAEEPRAYDVLHTATNALFDLLESRQIDYVLVGGMAMLQYVEGRNTRDIDLILSPSDLERLPELEISSREDPFARASFHGVQVDFLLTVNRVFEIVREKHATDKPFGGRIIRCATPEGLVLMKLFALPSLYRQGDFGRVGIYENDIAQLLQQLEIDAETLVAEIEREVSPSDFREMLSLVGELRERIARFDKRSALEGD